MSFDEAIRLTEILLGIAFAQQSAEHFRSFKNEQFIFIPRFIFAVLLIIGVQTVWVALLLLLTSLVSLYRFRGPYNGGADRMGLLILFCLCLVYVAPTFYWQQVAFGYLALQLVLSYFISGWVKIKNPQWRSGRALTDVFMFSAYPVSESLRGLSQSPRLLLLMSWYVILIELLFPLALLTKGSLVFALVITASFHFSNACFFGLNRFFWVWISAYPALLWFQQRFIG